MNGHLTSLIIAGVGALASVTVGYWNAQATAEQRVNEVSTEVAVIKEVQSRQDSAIAEIRIDVKEILRVVK